MIYNICTICYCIKIIKLYKSLLSKIIQIKNNCASLTQWCVELNKFIAVTNGTNVLISGESLFNETNGGEAILLNVIFGSYMEALWQATAKGMNDRLLHIKPKQSITFTNYSILFTKLTFE